MIDTVMNGNGHISSNGTSSPLQQYAQAISSAADTITNYCAANNLPQPSLDPHAPSIKLPATAPVEIYEARQMLIASTTRAQQVVTEPAEYLPYLSIHVGEFMLAPCTSAKPQDTTHHDRNG